MALGCYERFSIASVEPLAVLTDPDAVFAVPTTPLKIQILDPAPWITSALFIARTGLERYFAPGQGRTENDFNHHTDIQ